jgi:transcriptional regulator with XRE-family HTH domain
MNYIHLFTIVNRQFSYVRIERYFIGKARKLNVEFSEWLRERIKERPDLNQARLAELLGVYASTVHFWIKGRSLPDRDKVQGLAEIFHVEPNTIYQVLGFEVGQPYQSDKLGPLFEEVDRMINAIEDPTTRAALEDKIQHDMIGYRDLAEALTQALHALKPSPGEETHGQTGTTT